jgi:hypothetical protein
MGSPNTLVQNLNISGNTLPFDGMFIVDYDSLEIYEVRLDPIQIQAQLTMMD